VLKGCQVGSLLGAGGPSPALAQSSSELGFVSRRTGSSPAAPSTQSGITCWALQLHRAGLLHLERGRFARAKGDAGKLALAAFWWGGDRVSNSLAFSSFPQLWSGEKVDTRRIFCLAET